MDSVDGMDNLVCLLSGIHGLKSTGGAAQSIADWGLGEIRTQVTDFVRARLCSSVLVRALRTV